jgi:hypothetical protein
MQGRLIVFVCCLIVGVIAPAGISAQESSPVPAAISLPPPTGSYAVGRTSVEWIDTSRDEPFTPDSGGKHIAVPRREHAMRAVQAVGGSHNFLMPR